MCQCNHQSVLTTTPNFRTSKSCSNMIEHIPCSCLASRHRTSCKDWAWMLSTKRMHRILWYSVLSRGSFMTGSWVLRDAEMSKQSLRSSPWDRESQGDMKNIVEACKSLTLVFIASPCIYKAQEGVSVMLQEHKSIACIFKENWLDLGNMVYVWSMGKICDVQLHCTTLASIMCISTGNNLEASLWLVMNSAWDFIICYMHYVHWMC